MDDERRDRHKDIEEPAWIAVDSTRREASAPVLPDELPCPRCKGVLKRGHTTLTYQYAPAETQTQPVEGWVCPCGERYVPGPVAREAHRRAFQKEPRDQKA